MARFKSRVTSAFKFQHASDQLQHRKSDRQGPIAGQPGTLTSKAIRATRSRRGPGFALFSATYDANGLTLNADQYQIYDLVSLTYADVKYSYARKSPTNPFVAAQYLAESDTGERCSARCASTAPGLSSARAGAHVDVAASYNQVPFSTYVVNAADCSGDAASPSKIKTGTIFGGVPNASAPGFRPARCSATAEASHRRTPTTTRRTRSSPRPSARA